MNIISLRLHRYTPHSILLAVIFISLTVTGYQRDVNVDPIVEGSTQVDPRRIEIVVKSMRFMNNNPTFHVRPGETIEFRVLNLDPGMIHDMSIPDLGVKTPPLKEGQEALLLVTFPMNHSSNSFEYLCSFHPVSMRGLIKVDNGDSGSETWGKPH